MKTWPRLKGTGIWRKIVPPSDWNMRWKKLLNRFENSKKEGPDGHLYHLDGEKKSWDARRPLGILFFVIRLPLSRLLKTYCSPNSSNNVSIFISQARFHRLPAHLVQNRMLNATTPRRNILTHHPFGTLNPCLSRRRSWRKDLYLRSRRLRFPKIPPSPLLLHHWPHVPQAGFDQDSRMYLTPLP